VLWLVGASRVAHHRLTPRRVTFVECLRVDAGSAEA